MSAYGDGVEETDVLIIGGGLVGCAAAYYLALRDVEAFVVDRGEFNRAASGRNAGSLHMQMRADELAWEPEAQQDLIRMKRRAIEIWSGLEAELGHPVGVRLGGGYLLAETDEDLHTAKRLAEVQTRLGFEAELLAGPEVQQAAPSLSSHLAAVLHTPWDGKADTLALAPAFLRRAAEGGARARANTNIVALERRSGGFEARDDRGGRIHAKRVLIAAGPWTAELAGLLGYELKISSVLIQALVTERCPPVMGELLQHLRGGMTMKQMPNGTFMIGGGWPASYDEDGRRTVVTLSSLEKNLGVAMRVLPLLRQINVLRSWTGLITHAVNRYGHRTQIFGELPGLSGCYVLTGGTLVTLGPLYASLAAELISTGGTSLSVQYQRPELFA